MSFQSQPRMGHPGVHHPHSPKQAHPNQPHHRVSELLEALKHEVDVLYEEASYSKHHRKDLEGKIASQIQEMSAFQKSLYDLDRMHSSIKAGYEDEIKRLRHELESRGIPLPPPSNLGVRKSSLLPEANFDSNGNLEWLILDPNKRIKTDPGLNPSARHRGSIPGMKQMSQPGRQDPYRSAPIGDFRQNGYPPQQYHLGPPQSGNNPQHQVHHPQQHPQIAPKKPDEPLLSSNPRIQNANLSVEQLHCFDHASVVCCVKFSPDGNYLATGCNHLAQIFEISSGRKILVLVDESIPKQDDLYIRSVCFSPDGVYLATGAEDRVIRIWDIVNGRIKLKLTGHTQDIYSLDWTRDGKCIVSGSGDQSVRVWDPETGACRKNLQPSPDIDTGKDAGVTCVAIRPTDGRCVVAASLDENLRIWDLRTGHLLERFEGHQNSVYSVAFAPDGRSIVSGSLDHTLRIWDLSPATLAILAAPPSAEKPPVAVTTKHRHSFLGHKDYVLSVGYPGSHSTIGRVDSSGRPIQDPSFDVEWIVSGSKDRHVIFWDAKDAGKGGLGTESQPLLTMTGHKNSVISIAMGPTGGLFATGSGDLKARIWRVSRQITSPLNSGPTVHMTPTHHQHTSGAPTHAHAGQREPPNPNWDRRKSLASQSQSMSGGQPSPLLASPAQAHPPSHVQATSQPQTPAKPQNLAPVVALPIAKPATAPQSANSPIGNGKLSPRIPPAQQTGPPPSPSRNSPVAVKSPVQKSAHPPAPAGMDTAE